MQITESLTGATFDLAQVAPPVFRDTRCTFPVTFKVGAAAQITQAIASRAGRAILQPFTFCAFLLCSL